MTRHVVTVLTDAVAIKQTVSLRSIVVSDLSDGHNPKLTVCFTRKQRITPQITRLAEKLTTAELNIDLKSCPVLVSLHPALLIFPVTVYADHLRNLWM